MKRKSAMELARDMMEMFGGEAGFWQGKIHEIALNRVYYEGFTMWEVNRVFDKYIGISPERVQQLRRKHELARQFLNCVTSLMKLMQKSRPIQEDLLKLDEAYGKYKRS